MDFDAIKTAVISFVQENQAWAPFIIAGLAFGESVAFLSLLAPATVILLGLGALIGTADLKFWPLWLAAATGAIVGDLVSYWIGHRFQYTAFHVWPLSRHPAMIVKGEHFFHRFGPWAVFAGRFFGPARAVIPLLAGIFAMPVVLFLAATVASAFVWAFAMLAPGAGLSDYLGW
jgi:membrane protein DedA with SNARE-associated domain